MDINFLKALSLGYHTMPFIIARSIIPKLSVSGQSVGLSAAQLNQVQAFQSLLCLLPTQLSVPSVLVGRVASV